MNKKIFTVLAIATLISTFIACNSTKKTSTSTSKVSTKGYYDPSDAELAAIQKTDPSMSMGKLKEGYALYTGPCTRCHGAYNINKFSLEQWPKILDHMVPKAKLNELQRDAVYKYILAIKAVSKSK